MIVPWGGVGNVVGSPRNNRLQLVAAMAAVLLTTLAVAEDAPETSAENIQVVAVKVNLGGSTAFESFLKKYRDAVTRSGDDRVWSVSTNATGVITDYLIASPLPSVAALEPVEDPLAAMIELLGEEAEAVAASLEGAVAESSGRSWIARPELGRSAASGDPPVGFTVLYIDTKPGAEADFEAYMQGLVEASNKLDDVNWAAMSGTSGAPSDYLVTIPFFKWSDLDDPAVRTTRERMIEAFGEVDGAKRYASGVAAIENITTSLIRSRPDLSRPPANQGRTP